MSATGKRPWFLRLVRGYVRRRIARGLDGLHVAGLEAARAEARRRPVIVAANHVGWWDSLLVVALDEALGADSYALMDAEGIRLRPYFARLGAVPLARGRAAADRAGLRAAAALLDRPGRVLWTFPQGRYRPSHLRPLGFEPGVSLLARLAPDAAVLPVSLAYGWRRAPAPAAFVAFGAARDAATLDLAALEGDVAAGLDGIDRAVDGDAAAFSTLVRSRVFTPEEGVGARLLGARAEAGRDG